MEMGGEILMLVTYVKFMPIKECINLNALFDLLTAFRFFPDTLYYGAILLEKVVPLSTSGGLTQKIKETCQPCHQSFFAWPSREQSAGLEKTGTEYQVSRKLI